MTSCSGEVHFFSEERRHLLEHSIVASSIFFFSPACLSAPEEVGKSLHSPLLNAVQVLFVDVV